MPQAQAHSTRTAQTSLPAAERNRRQAAVREGIASAVIEGGTVGPAAQAILDAWATGAIDERTMLARIDALHGG